jgi:ketosteroid isomerase-like protein
MDADSNFLSALERHVSAIARHDIDEFAATVASDVRLVGTDGNVIEGAAAAIAAHRAWFADPAWQFDASERLVVESKGDVGWALLRIRYATAAHVARFNLFLLFTLESDGAWRLRYDQGTTIQA